MAGRGGDMSKKVRFKKKKKCAAMKLHSKLTDLEMGWLNDVYHSLHLGSCPRNNANSRSDLQEI